MNQERKGFRRILEPLAQILSEFVGRKISALCIVLQLLLRDFSDGEVMSLWMCEHQSRNGSVRAHHAVLSEGDADTLEGDEAVDEEVDGNVGQRCIAHSGAGALKLFLMASLHRELFLRGISPQLRSHLLVKPLRCSLCQSVEEPLGK